MVDGGVFEHKSSNDNVLLHNDVKLHMYNHWGSCNYVKCCVETFERYYMF